MAPGDVALSFAIETWPWTLPPTPPVTPWGVVSRKEGSEEELAA